MRLGRVDFGDHLPRNDRILRSPPQPLMLLLFRLAGTMAINAPVINGSDPGAVPGGSTKTPALGTNGAETGSTDV